ncbi:MAG: hypothetical protein PHO32_06095, partial [Candidatus Cloacimonetes bacterium]|nr:hypothetical protein [Candidatus Cloacimonadota bacterium]
MTEDGEVKHVTINNSAALRMGSCTLSVSENIENYGLLTFSSPDAVYIIDGDINFYAGSSTWFMYQGHMYIQGNLVFHQGSAIDMIGGSLEFIGTGTSQIICHSPASLYNLISSKESPYGVLISDLSTSPLTVNADIIVSAGSTLSQAYTGTTFLRNDLIVHTGGYFANNRTVQMTSTYSSSINFNGTDSYVCNLIINKEGTASVSLDSDIRITGNLDIQGGVFNAFNRTIRLKGNWTNPLGPTAFNCGVSTVILDGIGNQVISTERFYRLELNKGAGLWQIPTGVAIVTDYYNWTAGAYAVTGGSFSVAILDDPGIFGYINLSSGSINYSQRSTSFIDLRGQLTISGGTFSVDGGSSIAYFSYIDTATLNMSGGVLDFQSQGILVPDMFSFNDNITGGTIRTVGSFLVERSDFNPSGGTIELYGRQDCQVSTFTGSNLFNLDINKAPLRTELSRSNSVTGLGTLDINGNFRIVAGSFVAPPAMKVAGNWVNQLGVAAFTEGTGSVTFDGSSTQYCNNNENFNSLILNKSGYFKVSNPLALVTCASYSWTGGALEVVTGTFTAWDLAQNGIYGSYYVNPLGTINLYQGATQRIHLNGFFNNNGGTINVYGGSLASSFAFGAAAGIVMSGGTIDLKDNGISIAPSVNSLNINITGGTLRTNGGFTDTRGGLSFGGLVELYGTGSSNLQLGTGSSFLNLTINKGSVRNQSNLLSHDIQSSEIIILEQDIRENSVICLSNLQIFGTLNVAVGIFDVNGKVVTINNDLEISGTLRMNSVNSFLDVNDDVNWQSGSNTSVSTGYLYCGGDWLFAEYSNADLTGSTARMDNSYGAVITNASAASKFGNLEIYATDEDPVIDYITNNGNQLLINGDLRLYPVNTFNLNEAYCHVTGNSIFDTTAGLFVGDGGTFEVDGNLDLRGSLTTGPGSVIVHGEFVNYTGASLSIDQGSFINDSPWLEMRSNVVYLNCDMSVLSGSFELTHKTLVINSAPLRLFENAFLSVGAGFSATSAGAYEPVDGELRMSGGSYMNLVEISGGNYCNNFIVQKDNLECTVYLQAPLTVNGELNVINGVLNTYGFNVNAGEINVLGGNLEVHSDLSCLGNVDVSGVLDISAAAGLLLNAGSMLSVNDGGLLRLLGSVEQTAMLSRLGSSGFYGCNIESGGTIEASYATFEYINTTGLSVKSGAWVDENNSMNNCTFQNGATGGKLLQISNSQNIIINSAVFSTNTWNGAFNVSKTNNQGSVTFTNFTGAFSGSAFEHDLYNRIMWQNSALPPIQDLDISYLSETNTIRLDWVYSYPHQSFNIYSSQSPDGNFSFVGSTTNNYWVHVMPGSMSFYRVTAVQ